MRVLLINPPNTFEPGDDFYCTFPLGLAYIAAAVEQAGHCVKVIDALAGIDKPKLAACERVKVGTPDAELARMAVDYLPDVIGLSCSYTVQFPATVDLATALREHVSCPIVIGGAHGSAMPAEVLKTGAFDYVVVGEGEVAFVALLERLEAGRSGAGLPGIATLTSDGVSIGAKDFAAPVDEFLPPARHLFDMSKYINSPHSHNGHVQRFPYATMITSRGCPLDCTFCSVHTVWGRNNRRRQANDVVDEIQHLVDRYGIREVHFEDDMLTFNKNRIVEICKEISLRNIDISWATPNGIYVNTLNREVLEVMRQSGCYQLSLAIESGSPRVLRNIMKKKISLDCAREIVPIMRELGIGVYFFFVIGMPGETREDVMMTIEYAKELQPDDAYFSIATPYPGTELYDVCLREGYVDSDLDLTRIRPTNSLINTPWLSAEDVRDLRDFAYEEWMASQRTPAKGGQAIERRVVVSSKA